MLLRRYCCRRRKRHLGVSGDTPPPRRRPMGIAQGLGAGPIGAAGGSARRHCGAGGRIRTGEALRPPRPDLPGAPSGSRAVRAAVRGREPRGGAESPRCGVGVPLGWGSGAETPRFGAAGPSRAWDVEGTGLGWGRRAAIPFLGLEALQGLGRGTSECGAGSIPCVGLGFHWDGGAGASLLGLRCGRVGCECGAAAAWDGGWDTPGFGTHRVQGVGSDPRGTALWSPGMGPWGAGLPPQQWVWAPPRCSGSSRPACCPVLSPWPQSPVVPGAGRAVPSGRCARSGDVVGGAVGSPLLAPRSPMGSGAAR